MLNKDYFKRYTVTSDGKIFNKRTNQEVCQICVKYKNSKLEYFIVNLYDNNLQRKCLSVANLVAKKFVPNPKNFKFIHHIDGDSLNNNASNLCWVDGKLKSVKANNTIALRGGGKKYKRVAQYNLKNELVAIYNSISSTIKNGFTRNGVRNACINNTSYKNFIWKFISKDKV